jgi:hypothetical protein
MLETLQIIAQGLDRVPDEAVESQLVSFDALLGIPGMNLRADGVRLLRGAAEACTDPARRDRILKAAQAVEAGEPCAWTPEGLTGSQAAAAQTATLQDWEEQVAAERAAAERTGLPPLPDFGLRDMFPGLSVRIQQSFRDLDEQLVPAGQVLHFQELVYSAEDSSYRLGFKECRMRLSENHGNAYFQPVADLPSLVSCVRAIKQQWERVKPRPSGHVPRIESEIGACRGWVRGGQDRGPAPVCFTAPLAAKVFPAAGETEGLACRIAFLFAAVLHFDSPVPSERGFGEQSPP